MLFPLFEELNFGNCFRVGVLTANTASFHLRIFCVPLQFLQDIFVRYKILVLIPVSTAEKCASYFYSSGFFSSSTASKIFGFGFQSLIMCLQVDSSTFIVLDWIGFLKV